MYLSGHAPDKYTLTREPHRNAAAKPGPQAGTPPVEGNPANVMSDSLTDYLWGPRKIPDFVGNNNQKSQSNLV